MQNKTTIASKRIKMKAKRKGLKNRKGGGGGGRREKENTSLYKGYQLGEPQGRGTGGRGCN